MKNKELLEQLCKNLEQNLSKTNGVNRSVKLVINLQDEEHLGSGMYLGKGVPKKREFMTVCAVSVCVDDRVIYLRRQLLEQNTLVGDEVESACIKVLQEVFNFGVMASKAQIEGRLQIAQP